MAPAHRKALRHGTYYKILQRTGETLLHGRYESRERVYLLPQLPERLAKYEYTCGNYYVVGKIRDTASEHLTSEKRITKLESLLEMKCLENVLIMEGGQLLPDIFYNMSRNARYKAEEMPEREDLKESAFELLTGRFLIVTGFRRRCYNNRQCRTYRGGNSSQGGYAGDVFTRM